MGLDKAAKSMHGRAGDLPVGPSIFKESRQPSPQNRHGARLAPRLRADCHVEYCRKNARDGGDPMAEASVLAAPSAHLADNSRKAIWAAAIGNLLEWYDFGVYAYLAGLIAAKFFPGADPTASLSPRLRPMASASWRGRSAAS
jgi:hypothetical protein